MDKDREKAKESLKYMSGKEKVFHFIRYYKMPILVVSILIVISISLIGNFTFNKRPEGCLQIGVRAGVLEPDAIEALPGHLTEKYPDMTNRDVKIRLMESSKDLGLPKNQQGWGLIDLNKLLL